MENEARALRKFGIPSLNQSKMGPTIRARLKCARQWCFRFWQVLVNPGLNSKAKFQLYKLFVRPILTFGCEVWNLDQRSSKKLLEFEGAILTEIYKSKYSKRDPRRLKPNLDAVYARYRNQNVLSHIKNERLSWADLLNAECVAVRGPDPAKKHICWADLGTSCQRKAFKNAENTTNVPHDPKLDLRRLSSDSPQHPEIYLRHSARKSTLRINDPPG